MTVMIVAVRTTSSLDFVHSSAFGVSGQSQIDSSTSGGNFSMESWKVEVYFGQIGAVGQLLLMNW